MSIVLIDDYSDAQQTV